jgi:hypothetical protein
MIVPRVPSIIDSSVVEPGVKADYEEIKDAWVAFIGCTGCLKMDEEVILPQGSWDKCTCDEVVAVLRFTAMETMNGDNDWWLTSCTDMPSMPWEVGHCVTW